jgi:hypothetical protein
LSRLGAGHPQIVGGMLQKESHGAELDDAGVCRTGRCAAKLLAALLASLSCTRVAKSGDAYFLDLGQPGNSLAAKIEAGRWELLEQHEVRFIRPESMRPLPTPDAAGDIGKLLDVLTGKAFTRPFRSRLKD